MRRADRLFQIVQIIRGRRLATAALLATLVASVSMAQVWQDPELAQASQVALGKILSVLPASARAAAQCMAIYAPPVGLEPSVQHALGILRNCAQARRKAQFDYRDAKASASQRTVRPLGCFYWGSVWTLAAWCEARRTFRSFRLDRMASVSIVEGSTGLFNDESGKTLTDYLRSVAPPRMQEKLTSST
ncbi:MAG: WYL domain-containing protein, partial [Burkholderiaceae bacterium]